MNFPGTVYHRDHGPRSVQSMGDVSELVLRHGRGWNPDPVAAASGVDFVLDAPVPPTPDTVVSTVADPVADPVAPVSAAPAELTDEELEALTAPAASLTTVSESPDPTGDALTALEALGNQ